MAGFDPPVRALRGMPDRGGIAMSKQYDLMAALELAMVPSLMMRPDPRLYVPAVEAGEAVSRRRSRRRHFWCGLKDQQVEIEFETKMFLGFPRCAGVKSCSAFDEQGEVRCRRHCLDAGFRRQWPYALPTADHRRGPDAG
jgi:hypothetical protein